MCMYYYSYSGRVDKKATGPEKSWGQTANYSSPHVAATREEKRGERGPEMAALYHC